MPTFEQSIKLAICTPIPAEEVTLPDGTKRKRIANVLIEWHRMRQCLAAPFSWNTQEIKADGMEVGKARCHAAAMALDYGCTHLFFLDWDVLVPPKGLHRLMVKAQNHPDALVVSGVYCVKTDPPVPLIFKGWGIGGFWDWTPGDWLQEGITGCGMGCALINLDVFKHLPLTPENPWFKTISGEEYTSSAGMEFVTEDLWFLRRIAEEIGPNRIAIDTGILCDHVDPKTGIHYAMPPDSIPMRRRQAELDAEAKAAEKN